MRMPMTAEDVIVGIFYHLQMESRQRNTPGKITADRKALHGAFYELQQSHPQALRVFTFREREVFPESAQLDQALSNLDATGLISRQNFAPRYYQFEGPLESSYNQFSKRILSHNGVKQVEIRTIAKALYDRMKAEDPA
jgi:hypothetical protein